MSINDNKWWNNNRNRNNNKWRNNDNNNMKIIDNMTIIIWNERNKWNEILMKMIIMSKRKMKY